MINITESAQAYLIELLSKQDDDVIGIRIFINKPGTPKAETCIAYCRVDDKQDDDEEMLLEGLTVYLDGRSVPFLEDAFIDYSKDRSFYIGCDCSQISIVSVRLYNYLIIIQNCRHVVQLHNGI